MTETHPSAQPAVSQAPQSHQPTHDSELQRGPEVEHDARLEATELRAITPSLRRTYYYGADGQLIPGPGTSSDNGQTQGSIISARQVPHWYDGLAKFWERQVSAIVSVDGRRDHLALERTFLSYLRTSLALSMTGVMIAQLFRIQHSLEPDLEFGFYVVGRPLAAIFNGAALLVVLLGAWRFWRQQNAMLRGKVHAGGWEIISIMVLSTLLGIVVFALTVGIGIRREL